MKRQLSFLQWIPLVGALIFCVWPKFRRTWSFEFMVYQIITMTVLFILDMVVVMTAFAWIRWHSPG